eukprot:jgi/Chlat1/8092/Chrsp75S07588
MPGDSGEVSTPWGWLEARSAMARKHAGAPAVALTGKECVLGRTLPALVAFQKVLAISGTHCRLFQKDGCVMVLDTSTNGTFVNRTKVGKDDMPVFMFRSTPPAAETIKRKQSTGDNAMEPNKRLAGDNRISHSPASLSTLAELKEANEDLRRQLQDKIASLVSAEAAASAASQQHAQELEAAVARIENDWKQRVEQERQAAAEAQGELEVLKSEKASMTSEIDALQQRLARASTACQEAEDTVGRLRDQHAALEKSLTEVTAKLENQRVEAAAALSSLRAEKDAELAAQAEAEGKLRKDYEATIFDCKTAAAEMEARAESLRQKLGQERDMCDKADAKARSLASQLQEAQLAVARLESTTSQAQANAAKFEARVREEQAARQNADSVRASLEAELRVSGVARAAAEERARGAQEAEAILRHQLQGARASSTQVEEAVRESWQKLQNWLSGPPLHGPPPPSVHKPSVSSVPQPQYKSDSQLHADTDQECSTPTGTPLDDDDQQRAAHSAAHAQEPEETQDAEGMQDSAGAAQTDDELEESEVGPTPVQHQAEPPMDTQLLGDTQLHAPGARTAVLAGIQEEDTQMEMETDTDEEPQWLKRPGVTLETQKVECTAVLRVVTVAVQEADDEAANRPQHESISQAEPEVGVKQSRVLVESQDKENYWSPPDNVEHTAANNNNVDSQYSEHETPSKRGRDEASKWTHTPAATRSQSDDSSGLGKPSMKTVLNEYLALGPAGHGSPAPADSASPAAVNA